MSSTSDAGGETGDGAVDNGRSDRRRRRPDYSDTDDDEDSLHHRHRRKPPQLPPGLSVMMTSTVTSESQSLASPSTLQQSRSQDKPQLQLQSQQLQSQHQRNPQDKNLPQQPLSSMVANVNTSEPTNMDAEKNKKLLEWELSTLEANDLRSHAWYHGERVGRVDAERLLRKCVAEEHGIKMNTASKINKTSNLNNNGSTENTDIITNVTNTSVVENVNDLVAPREREEDSIGDLDSDDGLEDVSSISSDGDFAMDDYLDEQIDNDSRMLDPSMAASSPITAALLINQRNRMSGMLSVKRPKHQPRQHKYDDVDDERKRGEDERAQKKRLLKQLKRRQLRQQRHPVLHFVINEIILQPGTVYERSQFTFGDSLPSVASITTMSHNQRPIQPGFDSVPDLIRYYVGSAGDDAVLSYGGGNEEALGCGSNFPQTVPTEVRIRYPCNRRNPLTIESPSPASALKAEERSRLVHQHSHALAVAAALAKTLPVPSACTIVPVEPKFPANQLSNWAHEQSTITPSHRRTPSATVTSATITSVPSTAAELTIRDKQFDKSLPGSSKIISKSLNTEFISPLNQSSKTLPHQLTPITPRSQLISNSFSSSINRLSTTLPRASVSISSNSPSTSGASSNQDLLKMALLSSTSSSLVSNLKMTTGASTCEPSLVSPSFSSSLSKFAPSTSKSNNKPCSQIELFPSEPSTSTGFSTQGTSGSSKFHKVSAAKCSQEKGIIDIDAEIAAALDAENRISDDDFDFYVPEPTIVRSSFARVDLANTHQNRSNIHNSRSEVRIRRPENYFNRSERSRSRSRSRRRSSMSGLGNEPSQPQELLKHQNDQCQYQSHYQADGHNTHKQEKDNFEHSNNLRRLASGEVPVKRKFEPEIQGIEVPKKNMGEWTIQDLANSEIERMVRTGEMNHDNDSDLEVISPIGEENFEEWRARFTSSMINRSSDVSEQCMESVNRRPTRPIGQHVHSMQQGREIQVNPNQVESVRESVTTLSRTSPVIETAQSRRTDAPLKIHHNTTTSEPEVTRSSVRTANDVIVETMISRWIGIDSQIRNRERSTREENDGPEQSQNFHLDILHRSRRRRIDKNSLQGDHSSPTGDTTPPVKDYPLPAEKYINLPQLNQRKTQHKILSELHSNTSDVTKTSRSSKTIGFEGISENLTTTLPNLEVDNNSFSHDCSKRNLACDYENIKISFADNQECINSPDKNVGVFIDHLNINKTTLDRDSGNTHVNRQNIKKVENSVITSADYENIVSRNVNESKYIENYENLKGEEKKQCDQKIQRKLVYDDFGNSATVSAALLAVHLAIIGDLEDVNEPSSVAGTGKLAAALCRADGRAIVLPYRQQQIGIETERISMRPNFDSCPLQILDHPGPEGRRARLDVIESGNSRDPFDAADKKIKWTLEDEYEYRRRLFYYRCAGIGNGYLSADNSSSDDEDGELMSNSDLDYRNSQPTKEEWATEKQHWFDLLTRHRAAALDKWIRTAADAKQAVGDVYGYRALMTALCSDRIQTLRDAWETLRRVYTNTAVAFESRLRPEFLGRRDHQAMEMVNEAHDLKSDDMDVLLQLPPNATVPDPTALAVLYEHLYDEDNDSDNSNSTTSPSNNIERSTSMFTSPLLLSPSLWFTSNSGIGTIRGGLGTSVSVDYGLRALHDLCVQYSKWVQSCNNENSTHSPKPMLQLERFRRNFRTLLHQYNDGSGQDYVEDVYHDGFNYEDQYQKNHVKEFHFSRDEFVYERNYEEKMEEYGTSSGDYDDCGGDDDDEDDDATVICCSSGVNSTATKTSKEKLHYSWINAAIAHGRGPAPLDIVFRTELHVRLFWPPTLVLGGSYDDNDQDITEKNQLVVPAYVLGTTYAASAAAFYYNTNKEKRDNYPRESRLSLDKVINIQLNQAARDMHFRYKIMEDFLNKACSYSTLASKIAKSTVKDKHQHRLS